MGMLKKVAGWLSGANEDVGSTKREESKVAVPAAHQVEDGFVAPAPPLERQVQPLVDGAGSKELRPEHEHVQMPRSSGVKKVMLDEASVSILDLRELPSSRFRIVGSAYWLTDSGRYKHGGTEYLLVREPKNKWDANAVAVYGKGRKVGHLTEAKAAALAPIFDELGFGAYRVGGTAPAPNSIRMWVDLPAMPKLRAFAKTVGKAPGQ